MRFGWARAAGWRKGISNLKFQISKEEDGGDVDFAAQGEHHQKNQEKPGSGFRRSGAESPLEGLGAGSRTAPPRPIFARASVNGRENRAARSSG
jgi:hypothetical protein